MKFKPSRRKTAQFSESRLACGCLGRRAHNDVKTGNMPQISNPDVLAGVDDAEANNGVVPV